MLSPTLNNEKVHETSSLIGATLPQNQHELHDLVSKVGGAGIDDLVLLDWEQMEVDLLQE
jgi:hypothetical protein